jgi:hypothetical protein
MGLCVAALLRFPLRLTQNKRRALGVLPSPLWVGESHVSRTLLHWKKKLILKKAFLIRESLDGNTHFDFP